MKAWSKRTKILLAIAGVVILVVIALVTFQPPVSELFGTAIPRPPKPIISHEAYMGGKDLKLTITNPPAFPPYQCLWIASAPDGKDAKLAIKLINYTSNSVVVEPVSVTNPYWVWLNAVCYPIGQPIYSSLASWSCVDMRVVAPNPSWPDVLNIQYGKSGITRPFAGLCQ